MKIVIINTDYINFLRWFYHRNPTLAYRPYSEQLRMRNESLFGVADFYSFNLSRLGFEAYDIHANNIYMQTRWAKEHGVKLRDRYSLRVYLRWGILPWISRVEGQRWFYDILSEQIKYLRPDILLNQAICEVSTDFVMHMKPFVRLMVGQYAFVPSAKNENFTQYDVMVSSLPSTVAYFKKTGVPTELYRLGFEERVLSHVHHGKKKYGVSFIGRCAHNMDQSRIDLLEKLCNARDDIRLWGIIDASVSSKSPIWKYYMGEAWGYDMYKIIDESKIVINHHADTGPYANNMRLFEVTGMGTFLLTDWKENLHEMFEIGKEVVAYRDFNECMKFLDFYLQNYEKREAIAKAGQQRTLREHTYARRSQELAHILTKYLR